MIKSILHKKKKGKTFTQLKNVFLGFFANKKQNIEITKFFLTEKRLVKNKAKMASVK